MAMKFLSAMLAAFFMGATAMAVNSLEQGFKCPLDGTEWRQRIETSANPHGLRTDLRQLGDVVDPPTLPQCPKCRFPIFSDRLSEPVIERLQPFVAGADFQMLAPKNPSYFTLAQVQKFLRAPHRYIALSYLRASWQVEGRDVACRRLLEKAHEHFLGAVAELRPGDRRFADIVLLCGEVERRLEKWEEADARFRDLQGGEELKEPRLKPLVALQLKLIKQRDSSPRALDVSIDGQHTPVAQAPGVAADFFGKPEGARPSIEISGTLGKGNFGIQFGQAPQARPGAPRPAGADAPDRKSKSDYPDLAD
jgi:hypothetical protein